MESIVPNAWPICTLAIVFIIILFAKDWFYIKQLKKMNEQLDRLQNQSIEFPKSSDKLK